MRVRKALVRHVTSNEADARTWRDCVCVLLSFLALLPVQALDESTGLEKKLLAGAGAAAAACELRGPLRWGGRGGAVGCGELQGSGGFELRCSQGRSIGGVEQVRLRTWQRGG